MYNYVHIFIYILIYTHTQVLWVEIIEITTFSRPGTFRR